MNTRHTASRLLAISYLWAILALMSAPGYAQWLNVSPAKVPRTPDGKPDLSAPAPRLPDGRVDLSGIWEPTGSFVANIAANLKPGAVPFQPWAKALYEDRMTGKHWKEDPPANCLPQSVPRIGAAPAPWKMIHTPGFVAILYEAFNLWRQVFLDGRKLALGEDLTPTWMGYSTGTWDGDTLVVDSRGFNGKAWLDQLGKPTTDALHVIERFRRKNFWQMEIQITIDDPKAYTQPWTVTQEARLLPNTELLEFICLENEKDTRNK
jgi:hypothetical protein